MKPIFVEKVRLSEYIDYYLNKGASVIFTYQKIVKTNGWLPKLGLRKLSWSESNSIIMLNWRNENTKVEAQE